MKVENVPAAYPLEAVRWWRRNEIEPEQVVIEASGLVDVGHDRTERGRRSSRGWMLPI